MLSETGLSLAVITSLKLILAVSNTYYAKILQLYRNSSQHHRLGRGKVKNVKSLQVKIFPARRVAAVNAPPRIPLESKSSPTQSTENRDIRECPASSISSDPVEPTVEPPRKKLRPLQDTTVMNTQMLDLLPLLQRLQDSFSLPSLIVLRNNRWFVIRQRGPASIEEPPNFPEDLLTIKIPPGLWICRESK